MTLTKAADKFLCLVYAVYLKRVKQGMPRTDAMAFDVSEAWRGKLFPDLSDSDYRDILHELNTAFNLDVDMSGNFFLSHSALVYMENRFLLHLIHFGKIIFHDFFSILDFFLFCHRATT